MLRLINCKDMRSRLNVVLILLIVIILGSCKQNYSPKPRGYFRIDLPQREYIDFDTTFPYSFNYSNYIRIEQDPYSTNEKYWINLVMKDFDATLHLSYKVVDGNLEKYLEDSYTLVTKHIPKADAIYDNLVVDRDRNVFGLTYKIVGRGAASPYQFFLTDSSSHFLRGALYFNYLPNNDSLQPVIDFVIEDIEHIIETLEWKYKEPR